jgi:hypothetical protein
LRKVGAEQTATIKNTPQCPQQRLPLRRKFDQASRVCGNRQNRDTLHENKNELQRLLPRTAAFAVLKKSGGHGGTKMGYSFLMFHNSIL